MKLNRNDGQNRRSRRQSDNIIPEQGQSMNVWILRFFNQIFIVAVISLTAILINQYMNQPILPNIDGGKVPLLTKRAFSVNRIIFDDKDKFIQFYNRIANRDIFESPWEKPQPPKADEVPKVNDQPKVVLPEFQTLIRIAGIIVDQESSQAIIEDLREGGMRFMNIGQEIHGGRLVEIWEDKVIFIYDDERVELKP